MLHADPNRIQMLRHQTGQLGGLGEITLKEVQELRSQTENKLHELEERYNKAKNMHEIGYSILSKLLPNPEDRNVKPSCECNCHTEDHDHDHDHEHDKKSHEIKPFKKSKQTIPEPTFKFRDFSKGDAKTKLALHEPKRVNYKSSIEIESHGGCKN